MFVVLGKRSDEKLSEFLEGSGISEKLRYTIFPFLMDKEGKASGQLIQWLP